MSIPEIKSRGNVMRKFPEGIPSLECLEAVFVELLISPTIFKVFGVLCPDLSCSDQEGTGAPEIMFAQTEKHRFPNGFCMSPCKFHLRPREASGRPSRAPWTQLAEIVSFPNDFQGFRRDLS